MENIKVAIRIRPFLSKENSNNTFMKSTGENDQKIQLSKGSKIFKGYFDKIFFPNSTQEQVYNFIKPVLTSCLKGINSTILCYGQTGSGKTFTMFGNDWTYNLNKNKFNFDEFNFLIDKNFIVNPFNNNNGIIPRLIIELFNIVNQENSNVKISCSYIQIYNERIYDLLIDNTFNLKKKEFTLTSNKNQSEKIFYQEALKLINDKYRGIIIEGALEIIVNNFYNVFELLKIGELNRKKRQTNKNEMSSRSHTIFIIYYTNLTKQLTSKIYLCDLAGSEKYDNKENYKITHFNELKSINKSLSVLGNVIHILSSKKKNNHIPYKDSKLTHLLQNSIGGNSKTFLIANISPFDLNFDESYNTLKFAERAHNIKSKISPNKFIDDEFILKSHSEESKIIQRLNLEIKELREILKLRSKRGNLNTLQEEFIKLKEENKKLKYYVNENNNNNEMMRLIQENEFLKEQIRKLMSNNNNLSDDINNINYNNLNNDINNNNNFDYNKINNLNNNYNNLYNNLQVKKDLNKNIILTKGLKRTRNLNNIIDYKDNIISKTGKNIINNLPRSKSNINPKIIDKNSYNNYYLNSPNFKYSNSNFRTLSYDNKTVKKNNSSINSKLIEMTNKKLKMLDELHMNNRYQTEQIISALRNKSLDHQNNHFNFPKPKIQREIGLDFDLNF